MTWMGCPPQVLANLLKDGDLHGDAEKALHRAVVATNDQLHSDTSIDDSLSGTTCVSIVQRGPLLHISNVGDSRAIMAEWQGDKLVAVDLTHDQTPFR
jgi:serine/threonine protein phosphatase PrpC